MMRAAICLLLALSCGRAVAQGPQCRTAEVGAISPNCASEAMVTKSLGYHSIVAFAGLPVCDTATTGFAVFITNSNTSTFGATITGAGSNAGFAVCDGTNWTYR